MKNPNEPPAPRQTRLVLTLDAESSFLWSSWGLAMNHSWNTQTLVSIWTSEPARYIHSICASAMRTGGGNPSRMGLGQRPRPMLHFVLSRPKGLDEQRKYCPRMGIRIGLEGNTVLVIACITSVSLMCYSVSELTDRGCTCHDLTSKAVSENPRVTPGVLEQPSWLATSAAVDEVLAKSERELLSSVASRRPRRMDIATGLESNT